MNKRNFTALCLQVCNVWIESVLMLRRVLYWNLVKNHLIKKTNIKCLTTFFSLSMFSQWYWNYNVIFSRTLYVCAIKLQEMKMSVKTQLKWHLDINEIMTATTAPTSTKLLGNKVSSACYVHLLWMKSRFFSVRCAMCECMEFWYERPTLKELSNNKNAP